MDESETYFFSKTVIHSNFGQILSDNKYLFDFLCWISYDEAITATYSDDCSALSSFEFQFYSWKIK